MMDVHIHANRASRRASSVASSTTYATSKAGSGANTLGKTIKRQERDERRMKMRTSTTSASGYGPGAKGIEAGFGTALEAQAALPKFAPPQRTSARFQAQAAATPSWIESDSPTPPEISSSVLETTPPAEQALSPVPLAAEAQPRFSSASVDTGVPRQQVTVSSELRSAPDIDKTGHRGRGIARARSADAVGCLPGQERRMKQVESINQRRAHDQDLLEMLNPDFDQRREYPNVHMNCAFTDRTLRLREQTSPGVLPTNPLEGSPRQLAPSETSVAAHLAFAMGPAGLASNRVPVAGPIRHVAGAVTASQVDAKKNKSESVKAAIHQEDDEASVAAAEEHRQFAKQMGRKAKAIDPRDMQRDPTVAGSFHKATPSMTKARVKSDSAQRDDNAMACILSATAPPLHYITCSRKGRGEIRIPTEFSEKMAVRENQAAFRFQEYRSGSVGRKPQTSRNPITHEGMEGEGVISLGERKQRRPSISCSDQQSNLSFDDGMKEASAVRDARLLREPCFAALCKQTEQCNQVRCEEVGQLKSRYHHSRSSRLADCLAWSD